MADGYVKNWLRLDKAIQQFSLAYPSWYIKPCSTCTIKVRMRLILGGILIFILVFYNLWAFTNEAIMDVRWR